MPLLAPEPMIFPAGLFSADPHADMRTEWKWWVFQVRPQAEKATARLLAKAETPFFLPTYVRQWRKSGRDFRSQLPLFPGYVFVAGSDDARSAAFATRLVVREVPVKDHERLGRELAAVHIALTGTGPPRPEDTFPRGRQVAVVEGCYAGVVGVVREDGGQLRVCVEITLLGRGVSVGVERWMLRPVDPAAPGEPGLRTAD